MYLKHNTYVKYVVILTISTILFSGCDLLFKPSEFNYAVDIAAGTDTSFIISNEYTVWGTGNNDDYNLGLGNDQDQLSPSLIDHTNSFRSISSGEESTIFRTASACLFVCGGNSHGELGTGDLEPVRKPTQIPGLRQVDLAAVGANHIIYKDRNGQIIGAGSNEFGQLGNTSKGLLPTNPDFITVSIEEPVYEIAAGGNVTLFRTSWENGFVYGCGDNSSDALGIYYQEGKITVPTQIPGLGNIMTMVTSGDHSLFLTRDGEVYAVGKNTSGELGLGTVSDSVDRVQLIPDLSGIKAIYAGKGTSFFIKEDNTCWAVGNNAYGQLGLGDTENRATPTLITYPGKIMKVAPGTAHTLFMHPDGSIWGSGDNSQGQLGLGDTIQRNSPERIPCRISDLSPYLDYQ